MRLQCWSRLQALADPADACMLVASAHARPTLARQVFASGTGNRRHPLFFLDGLRNRLAASRPRTPRTSNELQLPTIASHKVWQQEVAAL